MDKTIAAIATPAGTGGLGVVRISGTSALSVAGKIFRPAQGKEVENAAGYTAMYGHVFDADGDIDDCVALVFRAPHSYTGEDVAELSCHGGQALLRRVLRAAFDAGAQAAAAGEFTRRAFLNGKLDLTAAEGVMDLIAADGKMAASLALSARKGAVFRRVTEVKAALLGVSAALSAYVDYPDDDIPELSPDLLGGVLRESEQKLIALLENYDAGRLVRDGVDTVIAGSPNVGKSTLMNLLAGCERSIVTELPGTTRDVVEETVRLGDITLRLADTAGIRHTDDRVEEIGVGRALGRMESASLVLAVFDGSRPLDSDDRRIAEMCAARPSVAIINKADLAQAIDEDEIRSLFSCVVVASAAEGGGVDELTRAVLEITGINHLDAKSPVLANERQRSCVLRCLDSIREAAAALVSGMTLDAVNICIDDGVSALLELVGERITDTVTDEIFARFCVGK